MIHSHAILLAGKQTKAFKAVSTAKPPYAIIFQSFQSASFSIGICSALLLSLIFYVWLRAIFSQNYFLTLRNAAMHC